LSQDRKCIFVSFDAQAKLATIRLSDTQDDLQQTVFNDTLLAGSHLFNWPWG
jgi:hypothetical protein